MYVNKYVYLAITQFHIDNKEQNTIFEKVPGLKKLKSINNLYVLLKKKNSKIIVWFKRKSESIN